MYLENWTPISSVHADSKLASKVSQQNQKGSSSNNPPQLIRFYRGQIHWRGGSLHSRHYRSH